MLKPNKFTKQVHKLEAKYGGIDNIPDDDPKLKKIQKQSHIIHSRKFRKRRVRQRYRSL